MSTTGAQQRRLASSTSSTTDSFSIFGVLLAVLLIINQMVFVSSEMQEELKCQGNISNSYLWKVESTPPIYLFGTMHVPYTKLWDDIPENAKVAFGSSQDLCVELRLSDPNTMNELANCQSLPSGQLLESVLSEDTIEKIDEYLKRIREVLPTWLSSSGSSLFLSGGVEFQSQRLYEAMTYNWQRKRPIWILLMLGSLTEENIRLRNIPLLDLFLDNAAEGLGKTVQAIESPRDQCKPLNKLDNSQVELALQVQLDYLESQLDDSTSKASIEENIHTYCCGDFKSLVTNTPLLPLPPLDNVTATSPGVTETELESLKEMERFLWNQMVVRRNRKMTKSIDELLRSERNITYFFALGAGHYLSEKNVVYRLRKKGYNIQHIPADQLIDGPPLPSNIKQLGDPDSVPKIMPILPETPETEPAVKPVDRPTVDPKRLAQIWSKYLIKTPSPWIQTTTTTVVPLEDDHIKDIRERSTLELNSDIPYQAASSSSTDEFWLEEISELYKPFESGSSYSAAVSAHRYLLSHYLSMLCIALLAILVHFVSF